MIHNIPQPVFEHFVMDHLLQNPNVDVRKGVSFVSLDQVRRSPFNVILLIDTDVLVDE